MMKSTRTFFCLVFGLAFLVGQGLHAQSSSASKTRQIQLLEFYNQDFRSLDGIFSSQVSVSLSDSDEYATPKHYINHQLALDWLDRLEQAGDLDNFSNRFYEKNATYFLKKHRIELFKNKNSPLFWSTSLQEYKNILKSCVQSFKGEMTPCLWRTLSDQVKNESYQRYTKILMIIGTTYVDHLNDYRKDFFREKHDQEQDNSS